MEIKQKRDRYEMHKYWGKKPSSDLNGIIEKYSKQGDTVLDPFSGYGVFCCEAYILNRNIISNDLNPIANFINSQLLNENIDISKIRKEWSLIKSELSPFIDKWYGHLYENKRVQLINILRDKNDTPLMGRFYVDNIGKVVEISFDDDQIRQYLDFENCEPISDWYPTIELIENSRISARNGMTVADLFPKRALACHSRLLSLIEKHSTNNELELLKLAFTANLANCSKLVPPIKSRGEMSQGAWMTGFYVGETYLENNVLSYFENRLNKAIKGKIDYLECINKDNLFTSSRKNTFRVLASDAKNLDIPNNSIDYVFTDPPYGDAVPYFEQSIIWNSWLKLEPNYIEEIVVSDSKKRDKTVAKFEQEIYSAISEIERVLKPEGYFSLTYHSLSGLEWKSITNACIKNNFEMVEFSWLVQKSFTPRQINRSKSIKGDVLVTFKKAELTKDIKKPIEATTSMFIGYIHEWLLECTLDTNEIFLRIMNMIFRERILIGDIDIFDVLSRNFSFNENNEWEIK